LPTKRINFTSRKRLTRDHANVVIHPAADPAAPATFDAQLDLEFLRPDADSARVFVEAYHQTTRMRFDFGTVAAVTALPPVDRRLLDFPDWKDVRFRVKVTDIAKSPGRILAWANRIKPKGPDDQDQPDLVRFKDADLYGLLWDIDFDDEGPVVKIERSMGGAQKIGRDDRFIAAVYPEILRRTLEQALLVEKRTRDDTESWYELWFDGFLKAKLSLNTEPPPDNERGRREWITDAVGRFAQKFQTVECWRSAERIAGGGT
jgi:hypothetical protein